MIKLGRLELSGKLLLAPMAMYSDVAMRKICYGYGCSYSFSEQIRADEFIAKDEKLAKKLDLFLPMGIQFLANDPEVLRKAIEMVNKKEFYLGLENVRSIDLNLGCPFLMNKNLGAALLNQPQLVRELFKVMKETSSLPISAKIRLAINAKHKKTKPYLRIVKIAEEEGLDFIVVHLRNAAQEYSGEIDLAALKEIRENVKIPLIGNGDIVDVKSGIKMKQFCDALMVGRQAVSDPYLFKQLDCAFKNMKCSIDVIKEKQKCIRQYLSYSEQYKIGFQHIKIHLQALLRDTGKDELIKDLTHTHTVEEIRDLVE